MVFMPVLLLYVPICPDVILKLSSTNSITLLALTISDLKGVIMVLKRKWEFLYTSAIIDPGVNMLDFTSVKFII
jgi:hypothetical protein